MGHWGYFTLLIGVVTPFITRRGPPGRYFDSKVSIRLFCFRGTPGNQALLRDDGGHKALFPGGGIGGRVCASRSKRHRSTNPK